MVGTPYLKKRLHVRVEHCCPSRCREDFLARRESNDKMKYEAKANKGKSGQGGGVGGGEVACLLQARRSLKCREDFLASRESNDKLKSEAKANKAAIPCTKRVTVGPRPGVMLLNVKPETITAIPYDIIKEGLKI
eukprot:gene14119-20073_t